MSRRPATLAQADLDRIAAFLKTMGTGVAAVDLTPGKARIITTDGQDLTLGGDEAELDRELQAYRQQRDHRAS